MLNLFKFWSKDIHLKNKSIKMYIKILQCSLLLHKIHYNGMSWDRKIYMSKQHYIKNKLNISYIFLVNDFAVTYIKKTFIF